jgi:predicted Zn-dependent protease with MMP-like domain
MSSDWTYLLALAESEVSRTIQCLPPALRESASQVPVSFERQPGKALQKDGIEPDTLGLFVGEPFSETGATMSPLPAQVILFLENIWEMAEENAEGYREEIRTTLLHELGHYLGLDETDLEERGLS